MNKIRNAAIILLGMGEKPASEILKSLSPGEVKAVINEINTIDEVSETDLIMALNEFFSETSKNVGFDTDYKNSIKSSLESLLDSCIVSENGNQRPNWVDRIRKEPIHSIIDLVKDEHPQIIAVFIIIIMNQVSNILASKIVKSMKKEIRDDVVKRMTSISSVSTYGVSLLSNYLETKFEDSKDYKVVNFDGVEVMANIVSYLDSESEKEIMSNLASANQGIDEKIQDILFPFEKLTQIDNKSMQILLKEVANEDLVLALKGTDEYIREMFMKNISTKAAEILKDDLESKGPVKLSSVVEAQKRIVMLAKKLSDEEKIVLNLKNQSDIVQ